MIQIRKQEICIVSIWQVPLTSYPHREERKKKIGTHVREKNNNNASLESFVF